MKQEMPKEIWATEVSRTTVYMNGSSPVNAYTRQIIHPSLGPATEYIRKDQYDTALALIAKMKEALETWKLAMPITNGDTLYSGHPKVMTEEALDAVREFEGKK